MEQELPAGLGERQVAEFIEDDEIEPGEMLGQLAGAILAPLELQAVHEVGGVVEARPGAGPNAAAGDGDAQVRLARARAADQHDVALAPHERTGSEITHERLVDRSSGKFEAVEVLGERQSCDRHLVLDRPGVLLGDFGLQQLADDVRVRPLA